MSRVPALEVPRWRSWDKDAGTWIDYDRVTSASLEGQYADGQQSGMICLNGLTCSVDFANGQMRQVSDDGISRDISRVVDLPSGDGSTSAAESVMSWIGSAAHAAASAVGWVASELLATAASPGACVQRFDGAPSVRHGQKPSESHGQYEQPALFVPGRGWVPYAADRQSIVVIAPGAGTEKNLRLYQQLQAAGFTLSLIMAGDLDQYPPGWQSGAPDLSFNQGHNLAALADGFLHSTITDLVEKGHGPSAVIAGSRGGQVTVPRMWKCVWRGPTIVINGGCAGVVAVPPAPVRLVLATCGKDFFKTCDPRWTRKVLTKEDPRRAVLLYHNPRDQHLPGELDGVLPELLKLALDGFSRRQDCSWREGTSVEEI